MDKIELFLASQEQELAFEREQLHEEVLRVRRQIEEFREKIAKLQESKDYSYEVFSASRADFAKDSELEAMEGVVSDKIQHADALEKRIAALDQQLTQIRDLDYHQSSRGNYGDEEIIAKLQLIYKWVLVDPHRAQSEILHLIRNMQE